MESLDVAVTFRRHGSIRPAVCEKRKLPGRIPGRFVQFFDEQGAAEGRLKRGDEESVVGARLVARNRAEGVSPDAVGRQPLARFRLAQVAANVWAEIDHAGKCQRGMVGWEFHGRIM